MQRSEDKAVAFRIEKEKKEKQMRREAFMMQAAEAARLKQNESHDIINKMVISTNVGILIPIPGLHNLQIRTQNNPPRSQKQADDRPCLQPPPIHIH